MSISKNEYDRIKRISVEYLVNYSISRGFGKDYDFSRIPVKIYERDNPEEFLIVIESPENDVFYAPPGIIYKDKAFLTVINNKVLENEDPFSSSAPLWYYQNSELEMKTMGLYPGSKYFREELDRIKKSFMTNKVVINMKNYSGLDLIITTDQLENFFIEKGIFYMATESLVSFIIHKTLEMGEGLVDKSYRFEIFYDLENGAVKEISTLDTTPPPCLM